MYKVFIIVIGLSIPRESKEQVVGSMKIDQLEARLAHGGDTTFIINLWATWCVPCVEELPEFEKFREQFAGDKMKVLLLSVDNITLLKSKVIPFVKRKNLKNEVWVLNEENQQEYIDRIDVRWSGALPATVFINRKKREFFERQFTLPELIHSYQKFQAL
jgi:thiol-disulfide isomerase/thioredoxin